MIWKKRGFFDLRIVLAAVLVLLQASNASGGGVSSSMKEMRYNRVEGLHLGTHVELWRTGGGLIIPELYGGYGLSSKEATYGLRIKFKSGLVGKAVLNIDVFHDIGTADKGLIGYAENSAAAFLLKEDFLDYFLMEGFDVNAVYPLTKKHNVGLSFANMNYETISTASDWSIADLFGSEKKFRVNPDIDKGIEHRLTVVYSFDSRINKFFPQDDLILSMHVERGGGQIGGNFEYSGIRLYMTKYKRTFGAQRLVLRTFLGNRDIPKGEQFLFDLGGVGTLRGFNHKEFTGNRAGMLNLDYFFNRAIIKRLPFKFIPFSSSLSTVIFLDAGWTNYSDRVIGESRTFSLKEVRVNIGLGVSVWHELLRINMARRLDEFGGIIVTARLFQRL